MQNSVQKVTAGKPKIGGSLFRAPLTETPPTDATTSLSGNFTCLGYISDDGLTNSTNKETTVVKAWGGDTVKVLHTSKTDTFHYKLLQVLDVDVMKSVYGDSNVTGTLDTGVTIKANNVEQSGNVLVFEMVLNETIKKRVVIPNGVVTEVADILYKDDEVVGYETTITALADSTGNTHYEYIYGPTGATGQT